MTKSKEKKFEADMTPEEYAQYYKINLQDARVELQKQQQLVDKTFKVLHEMFKNKTTLGVNDQIVIY